MCTFAGVAVLAFLAAAGLLRVDAQSSPGQNAAAHTAWTQTQAAANPANAPAQPDTTTLPDATTLPDLKTVPDTVILARQGETAASNNGNEQAVASAAAAKQPAGSAVVDPQKQEIANECSDLLKMATALKTAVDKTTKDTLSVTVVRQAGEIELLAHKVRVGPGKS